MEDNASKYAIGVSRVAYPPKVSRGKEFAAQMNPTDRDWISESSQRGPVPQIKVGFLKCVPQRGIFSPVPMKVAAR